MRGFPLIARLAIVAGALATMAVVADAGSASADPKSCALSSNDYAAYRQCLQREDQAEKDNQAHADKQYDECMATTHNKSFCEQAGT